MAHQQGCLYCGDKLYRGNYKRKPRGGLQWAQRFSFCCARCRRRRTPESVRFLGRRVYAGLVVVLVSAMAHGLKPERVRRLREVLQIDVRTLERWRRWWRDDFPLTPLWQAACARFMPPVATKHCPASLLERFVGDAEEALMRLLVFLSPLTVRAVALRDGR